MEAWDQSCWSLDMHVLAEASRMCKQHLISLGVQCSLVLHVKGPRITESLTLLQMNMDACKASAVACSFFYDELAVPVESSILHASIIEWWGGLTQHEAWLEADYSPNWFLNKIQNTCSVILADSCIRVCSVQYGSLGSTTELMFSVTLHYFVCLRTLLP